MDELLADLETAFRDVVRPPHVEGDRFGIDASTEQIERLLHSDRRALKVEDFLGYVGYAGLTTGGVDDFRYLLPTMLRLWRDEVLCSSDGWFTQYFHGNMADIGVREQLTAAQRAAVDRFLHDVLLHRIGSETSLDIYGLEPTHAWFGYFASFGVLTEAISSLWKAWWTMPTAGHACAALQFASVIICDDASNPIFEPWHPREGGGPPQIWEYDSIRFDERWKPENLEFLRATLSVAYLEAAIERAVGVLPKSERRAAEALQEELSTGPQDRTTARCIAIANAFEHPRRPDLSDWSTYGAW